MRQCFKITSFQCQKTRVVGKWVGSTKATLFQTLLNLCLSFNVVQSSPRNDRPVRAEPIHANSHADHPSPNAQPQLLPPILSV